jgi:hypothetical protein
MEQSPSWETDSHTADKEIHRHLWTPKACYSVHKNSLLDSHQSFSLASPIIIPGLISLIYLCLFCYTHLPQSLLISLYGLSHWVVQAMTYLTYIWKGQGSNLGLNTNLTELLCSFLHALRANTGIARGPFETFVDWRQCAAVMQREAVTVMPSCSGGDNLVVAWSSSL